jgi:hypothetical protein
MEQTKYLVVLRMEIGETLVPANKFHCEIYEAPHILDLLKEISRDNQGLKYDIVQITLIS